MYNQFIQHANATSNIYYVVGSGPLSIAYPPETFSNTWYSGCGNITAYLVEYDKALAKLKTDEIVIDTSDQEQIGKITELVFDCWLVWDEIQFVPDPFIMTIQFFGSLDEIDALLSSQAGEGTNLEDSSHLDSILVDFEQASFEIAGTSPIITFNIREAVDLEFELGVLVYVSPSEDFEYQVKIQQDESS